MKVKRGNAEVEVDDIRDLQPNDVIISPRPSREEAIDRLRASKEKDTQDLLIALGLDDVNV